VSQFKNLGIALPIRSANQRRFRRLRVDRSHHVRHVHNPAENSCSHRRGCPPSVLWTRQKLSKTKYSASAWQWFSNFFDNAFVNRVKRLMLILMVNDNLLSDYYDMSAKPLVQGMRLRVVR
jgi:hypothetical protein